MAQPILTGDVMQFSPEYIEDWAKQVTAFCKGAKNIVEIEGLYINRIGNLYSVIGTVEMVSGEADALPSPALKDTFLPTSNGDVASITEGSTIITYNDFTGSLSINGQYFGE